MFEKKTLYMGLQQLLNSNNEEETKKHLIALGNFFKKFEFKKYSHTQFYQYLDRNFQEYLNKNLNLSSKEKQEYLDFGKEIYSKLKTASDFYYVNLNPSSKVLSDARIKEMNGLSSLIRKYSL